MKPEIIHKLDQLHSEWIRRKDADEAGNVKCFITGGIRHWSKMVAGHWRHRRHLATRWDERNVHPITPEANKKDEEDMAPYFNAMNLAYGIEVMDEIAQLSNIDPHYSESDGKEMIKDLKIKLEGLE